ncbi:MAG: YbgF trimerization domain-containing protein, partial [Betaproteobacteria bacterium]
MRGERLLSRLIPVALALGLHGIAAHAGLFDDDEARRQVAETKRRVEDVNRQLDSRITALETTVKSQGLLDLFTQVEALRGDLATLRGQIEVLNNDMESTQKRQRDLYVDLDSRMRKMETAQQQAAAAAAAAAAAQAAATAAAAAAAPPPVTAPGGGPPGSPTAPGADATL